jgi:hypothetical protein
MNTSIMVAHFIQQPMVVYGTPPLITGNYRLPFICFKNITEDSIGILKVTHREFGHITN